MTSALAAALRELEHSRHALEKELGALRAFAEWRRLEDAANTTEIARQRRELLASLEQLPVFRAWRSVVATYDMLVGEAGVVTARAVAPERAFPGETTARWRKQGGALFSGQSESFSSPRRFSPPPGPPQALTAIRGISAAMAQQLEAMGVQRYAQIAAWTADDVRHVRTVLGVGKDISRRNWIEQAALLDAKGDYRAKRGGAGTMVSHGAASPAVSSAPLQHVPAVAQQAPSPVSPSLPVLAVASIDADTMRAAASSAAAVAARAATSILAEWGLRHAETVAVPAGPMVPKVEDQSREADMVASAPGRAALSDCGNPAAGHVTFGEVRPIRRPLPRRPASRSERMALQTTLPAPPEALQPERHPTATIPPPDCELRHIKGIDLDIAEALKGSGCNDFARISGWRRDDIRRVAASLGIDWQRICREGWIEQAALLASGRLSDFSARFRRGDINAVCLPPPPPPLVAAPQHSYPPIGELRPAEHSLGSPEASPAPSVAQDHVPAAAGAPEPQVAAVPPVPPPRINVEPPSIMPPALSDEIELDLPDTQPAEAVVTVVRTKTASGPHSPSTGSGVLPRVAEAFRAPVRADVHSGETSIATDVHEPWIAPVAIEEASIEIVRKDGVVAASHAPTSRVSYPLREPTSRLLPARRPQSQPVWISERDVEAGSVVRRFLKALKRDG